MGHISTHLAEPIIFPSSFAEYCALLGAQDAQEPETRIPATLTPPSSPPRACRGLDKFRPRLGSSVLIFGAGPTALKCWRSCCARMATAK